MSDYEINDLIRKRMFEELDHIREERKKWVRIKAESDSKWLGLGKHLYREKSDVISQHIEMLTAKILELEEKLLKRDAIHPRGPIAQ